MALTIELSRSSAWLPESMTSTTDRPALAKSTGSDQTEPVDERAPTSDAHSARGDYYDPAWGEFVLSQGVDETQEPWFRWLPYMRVYGFVVLAAALLTAYPRDDASGWRAPLALATMAFLTVDFGVMWVRRPIWRYGERVLKAHGVLLLVAYVALIAVSPPFAILQALVYPQVLFSLPLRWSVVGGLSIGVITALDVLVRSNADLTAAAPGLVFNLVTPAMLVALAIWIRETISQSMERRALIVQLRTARQERAAAERLAGVAEERARLAREIHDTLAQGFASIVTHLEAADASLDTDAERTRRDVRAAEEVARSSLAEARTLVWALRPETIATAGLPAAIERVAGAAGGAGAPAVEVTISGRLRQLHPEVEVTLLRAAQECLANARRHAAASRIAVTLTYFADEVSLDVIDDGCGFDPAGAGARSAGMGLLGMRERAERLGGTLAIESAVGEGTAVAVTLPAIEPPVPASADPPAPSPAATTASPSGRLDR